ncbi:protein-tyrosine phosphatase-like protein [Entophlyctis helioformis]|nr:protein-tyrosine phosphatase-like protein [Entophlyctis helioformis]
MSASLSQSSSVSGRVSPNRSQLTRIFSQIECGSMRFVILDCPSDASLPDYLRELLARGVTDVVRVCEPTYDTALLLANNISVHDWPFKDGGVPPAEIIHDFLKLADARFGGLALPKDDPSSHKQSLTACIAVHCVAGLGRAPVLVAITLIEAGMAPVDAIAFVRKYRRGAFNSVQVQYLADTYKRFYNKRPATLHGLSSFLGKRTSSPNIPPKTLSMSSSSSSSSSSPTASNPHTTTATTTTTTTTTNAERQGQHRRQHPQQQR